MIWFGLVGFYGISTILGYLMLNPLYTYILNIYICKHSQTSLMSSLYPVKLFLILLNNRNNLVNYSFVCTQFVIFDSLMEPYQVLLLQVRIDLRAMAMKWYSVFTKSPNLKAHHQIV